MPTNLKFIHNIKNTYAHTQQHNAYRQYQTFFSNLLL